MEVKNRADLEQSIKEARVCIGNNKEEEEEKAKRT
jgi:hypothetical protein